MNILLPEHMTAEERRFSSNAQLVMAARGEDGTLYGLAYQIYTVSLQVDVQEHSYTRRYCYDNLQLATAALMGWDPETHSHPPGPWIKLKGIYDHENANHRPDHVHHDDTLCLWNEDMECVRCGASEYRGVHYADSGTTNKTGDLFSETPYVLYRRRHGGPEYMEEVG